MAEHSFLKRNWKLLLNIATLVALVLLVFLIRDQIIETFNNLRTVNLWAIAWLLPLLLVNFHSQAKMYQGLFAALGNRLHYGFMLRAAIELNFVNKVFPSGGVSGISYFGMRLRSKDITGGRATMVQLMKLLLQFASFEILLIAGMLFLAMGGHVNNMVILVGSSISTLLVVGTVAFGFVMGSEHRIHATFGALTAALNWVVSRFRRKEKEAISMERAERLVQEMHNNYNLLFKQFRQLKWPFVWGLTLNMAEIASIYAVYVAFGSWVNVGAIILAYAVANFAGLVSVLPGGVGIYEVLMTGVLTAAGVPLALSLPATVMFRVLSTILQVIPGYYFYHKTVREAGKPSAAT
jgi:uncharacterized protein (TIRG00374 family)